MPSRTIYTLGGEAEVYIGSLTLGGDVDYNWTEASGPSSNFWTARGWVDIYLAPNARIGAEFNYVSWDDFGFGLGGPEAWGATVDAEYRFAGTPISAWIEGRYANSDVLGCIGSCGVDTWSGLFGFRIFMDAPGTTLEQHDKTVPWDGGLIDLRNTVFIALF